MKPMEQELIYNRRRWRFEEKKDKEDDPRPEDTTAAAAVNQPITGGLLCYVYPMKGKRKIRRIITTTTGSKVNTRDE